MFADLFPAAQQALRRTRAGSALAAAPGRAVENSWQSPAAIRRTPDLWDHDWAMSNVVMDLAPEYSDERKEFLTIDRDYYFAIAPDPTELELARIRELIRRLTARVS